MYSSLHAKGFKLRIFAKTPSFSSSSFFLLRTAERAAILKHWSCNVDLDDHYQHLSLFDDCVQRIQRSLPHATTITRGGQISLQGIVYTLRRGDFSWSTSWTFERCHDSPLLIRYPTNTTFLTRRVFCTSVLSFEYVADRGPKNYVECFRAVYNAYTLWVQFLKSRRQSVSNNFSRWPKL